MAKKRVDPIKQREKRAKVLLGVCGVFLLGAVVFEGPTFMKLFSPAKPPAATAPPTSTTAGALALPGSTPTGATTAPAAGDLVDTDLPPASAPAGQLVSFGLFETKNPFTPQVAVTGPNDAGTGSATPAVPPATTGPAPTASPGPSKAGADVPPATTTPTPAPPTSTVTTPTSVPASPAASGDGTTTTSTTPTVAPAVSVTISVNGRSQRVGKDGTFPSGAPVFRLVSFRHGSAQVAIVGGSYQTGDPTLTLKQGTKVTLENTSDNTRYTLLLISTP